MGIAVQCPNGHRLKVKDQFAGKKAVCPHCGAQFRVPAASGGARPLPTARIVPLDPAVVATLPRAYALNAAPPAAPTASPGPVTLPAALPASLPPPAFMPTPALHPLIAEQPAAMWSLALPGGQPTEPMAGDVMQQWIDSGQATGAELVWRSDWPDWLPITQVFPEMAGFPPG